jgi:hypothetical protein
MKKFILIAFLLTSTAAVAQEAPSVPATGGPAEKTFQERKAKALDYVGQRLAEMQKRHDCIEAASTPESLDDCFFYKPEAHTGDTEKK